MRSYRDWVFLGTFSEFRLFGTKCPPRSNASCGSVISSSVIVFSAFSIPLTSPVSFLPDWISECKVSLLLLLELFFGFVISQNKTVRFESFFGRLFFTITTNQIAIESCRGEVRKSNSGRKFSMNDCNVFVWLKVWCLLFSISFLNFIFFMWSLSGASSSFQLDSSYFTRSSYEVELTYWSKGYSRPSALFRLFIGLANWPIRVIQM